MPVVRLPREGNELQRALGTLFVLSRTGNGSDPRGGGPSPIVLPQVRHVCHMEGT